MTYYGNTKKPCPPCKVCQTPVKIHRHVFCSASCFQTFKRNLKKEEFLKKGVVRNVASRTIKAYLVELRGHACQVCKLTEWMGKPIPLVMDHVNGNAEDNHAENLRLICGNCDMQLPTYKSKNRGNGRAWRRERYRKGLSY